MSTTTSRLSGLALWALLTLGVLGGGAYLAGAASSGDTTSSGPARDEAPTTATTASSASTSPTVLPDPRGGPAENDVDPRCDAQYGDPHRALEKGLRIRPLGWPRTPPEAVLCRIVRVSATEEVGCYATDPGTKIYDIHWYYDHAISRQTRGVSGYATIGSGQQILTGVLGDASFYIEQPAFNRYIIVWARDGEYDDEADVSC